SGVSRGTPHTASPSVTFGCCGGRGMRFQEPVFSVVQPTCKLHIGSYLGAIKRCVGRQRPYDCIYCVVTMYAMTVWQGTDSRLRACAIRMTTVLSLSCRSDLAKHSLSNPRPVATSTAPA